MTKTLELSIELSKEVNQSNPSLGSKQNRSTDSRDDCIAGEVIQYFLPSLAWLNLIDFPNNDKTLAN